MSDTQRYRSADRHHQKASLQIQAKQPLKRRQAAAPDPMLFITAKASFKITILRIRALHSRQGGMRKIKWLAGGVGHVLSLSTRKKYPHQPIEGTSEGE
jgi:hypothetical protein